MLGIFSALGAACSWTYACSLWRQQTKYFSSIEINSIKNIIAFCIFSPVILTLDFNSNFKEIYLLLVSGFIGIAVGDSFYIASLKKLGTRRTLTFEAISPLLATILGSFLLNEKPQFNVWIGTLIVTVSLIGVASQRAKGEEFEDSIPSQNNGIFFALISVLCAVIAAILSRNVLINSNLNPFQTTEIRLLGSLIALFPFVRIDVYEKIKRLSFENKFRLFLATFVGTNLGILLQQNVFKALPIGLGWTLLSTSPAFSLLLAKSEGEKLNWKNLALTASTISGLAIAFISI